MAWQLEKLKYILRGKYWQRDNNINIIKFDFITESLEGLLCINAGLALGLLLLWLIIQIVLTGGCLYTVKKYKRMAREAEEDRADVLARHLYGIHGGNFEVSRRVRWADNGDSLLN